MLGPVEAHAAGQRIELGRPQQRLVLAILLADPGRVTSTQMLIDRIWETAEEGARRRLHVHITRLRRLLAQPGDSTGAVVPLVHLSGGYLLEVDPARVDLHRFRRLVADARDAHSSAVDRAARLREATGLWHGEPLAGIPGHWAARTRTAWQREYLDSIVLWAQSEARIGNSAAVIGPLTELAAQHPLVEPLVMELMRALYCLGRPADALDLYTRTRQALVDELGIDPGRELHQLYLAILRRDTDLPHTPR